MVTYPFPEDYSPPSLAAPEEPLDAQLVNPVDHGQCSATTRLTNCLPHAELDPDEAAVLPDAPEEPAARSTKSQYLDSCFTPSILTSGQESSCGIGSCGSRIVGVIRG